MRIWVNKRIQILGFTLFTIIVVRSIHGGTPHTCCLSGNVGSAFFEAFFGNREISIGAAGVYCSDVNRIGRRSLAHIRAVSALLAESATMRAEEILVHALRNWDLAANLIITWPTLFCQLPLVRCMVLRCVAMPGRHACWCILGCWC